MQFYIFHKKAFYLSTPGPARKRRLQTPGCDSGVWCTVKVYHKVTFIFLKAKNTKEIRNYLKMFINVSKSMQ